MRFVKIRKKKRRHGRKRETGGKMRAYIKRVQGKVCRAENEE